MYKHWPKGAPEHWKKKVCTNHQCLNTVMEYRQQWTVIDGIKVFRRELVCPLCERVVEYRDSFEKSLGK